MTVEQTIAVIGATGAQGGSVTRSLLQNPHIRVRCITRDASTPKATELRDLGATVVQADTTSPQALEQALAGVWGLYVNYTVFGMEPTVSENLGKTILSSAAAVGVKHVVFSSDPDPELLTGGQVILSAMGVKAKAEAWARKNLHFKSFTPIQAGWYLENFQSKELLEFHGGFPSQTDQEGYRTCRFPYWGGREEVPWISIRDDYGDLVHGVFLNPLRWNFRVIQAVADPLSFGEMTRIFSQVTGQAARFVPYASPAELGGDLTEGPASMFVYTQLRGGEYFSNGVTETRTAVQLKKAAYRAKGGQGRETLTGVGEWFEREFPGGRPVAI
ncbi:NmrA-like family domain-containing oxidoreductase himF [Penicillium oxalicum]|uniref:NmrA-like family domain-containing oxidoreductase himF n=1 Tax=Penicillium oxalicum TaxID=69781 RepID=UPI0020B87147|nr:NmrA-like family domain-containing oxidoreductase himF [Penicillium oxalicum]KAI2791388.1 NmrA-like family domain-containing oxidoreductase himF [Penicillium oxalicum]